MNRYLLKNAGVSLLSLALAGAMVLLTFTSMLLILFSGGSYTAGEMNKHAAEIVAVVDEAVRPAAKRLGIPEEALVGAVNEDNISVITDVVSENIAKGYITDFSDNTALFNLYMKKLQAYGEETGAPLSDKDKLEDASYAVDVVADALYTSETVSVGLFNYAKNRMVMYAVVVAILLIIFSVIMIDILTIGRHRKFSYYGMALVTAGYVNIGVPIWIQYKGYIGRMKAMTFSAYNAAIISTAQTMLRLIIIVGAVLLVSGLVMLILNYNYFRKKNAEIKASRERNETLSEDYMKVNTPASRHRPGEEFEKEIMLIDFDE